MDKIVEERIGQARKLLNSVNNAAMATVNADGSPHNTPYFFMRDAALTHLYWGSSAEAQHSRNIERTGQLFVVLYDAFDRGGLYISATDAHIAEGAELDEALAVHNKRRAEAGKEPLPRKYYEADSPQRMYKATIRQFWVYVSERGDDGLLVRDSRHQITTQDII